MNADTVKQIITKLSVVDVINKAVDAREIVIEQNGGDEKVFDNNYELAKSVIDNEGKEIEELIVSDLSPILFKKYVNQINSILIKLDEYYQIMDANRVQKSLFKISSWLTPVPPKYTESLKHIKEKIDLYNSIKNDIEERQESHKTDTEKKNQENVEKKQKEAEKKQKEAEDAAQLKKNQEAAAAKAAEEEKNAKIAASNLNMKNLCDSIVTAYENNKENGILHAIYTTLGINNYTNDYIIQGNSEDDVNTMVDTVIANLQPNQNMFIYASGDKPNYSVSANYYLKTNNMTSIDEFITTLMKGTHTMAEQIYCPQLLPIEITNHATPINDFKIGDVEYENTTHVHTIVISSVDTTTINIYIAGKK
jgi:hypothetical protein